MSITSNDAIETTPAAPARRLRVRFGIYAVAVVAAGLWAELESGFHLVRGTSMARGIVGIVGLGVLALAAEVTGEALATRDKISDALPRRVASLIVFLVAVAVCVALVWLWWRLLGVAQ
jgi:hypothetical protein